MSVIRQPDLFSPRWSLDTVTQRAPVKWIPEDPFLKYHEETLRAAGPNRIKFDEDCWDYATPGAVGLDVEVYKNFFLVCLKRFKDGTKLTFERSARGNFDTGALKHVLDNNLTVSFNGLTYDLPILYLAMSGATIEKLKEFSDRIIHSDLKHWDVWRNLNVKPPRWRHIDLLEPNPAVRQGLKMMHGRLHGRFLVDLPFPPETVLTPEQMNVVTLYCFNDVDGNETLYTALREPLELRRALGKRYGLDLLSNSDAQVGERIVKKMVEERLGRRVARSGAVIADRFRYEVPEFIHFDTPKLQAIVEGLRQTSFQVDGAGEIKTPPILEDQKIRIGNTEYAMGIGGLHSTEAHRALYSDEERQLIDVDMASQYPSVILILGLYPKALGPAFLEIYGELRDERLQAKEAYRLHKLEVDRVKMDGGRVSLNGVYGKLGSPYSVLYAPHLVIAITVTCQLTILMLIERAETAGIPVVSANTDGVVFYLPRTHKEILSEVLATWQKDTGFVAEATPYRAMFNSSVNTYIAVKEDGKAKRKGFIADPWTEGDLRGQMSKNPQAEICSEAVLRYILEGTSIEDTIRNCRDPKMFVSLIRVSEGGVWRGFPLGRAARYYWSVDGDPILTAKQHKRVSKTEGSKPLMELTDELPDDIDYLRYCEEAARLATELGADLTRWRKL